MFGDSAAAEEDARGYDMRAVVKAEKDKAKGKRYAKCTPFFIRSYLISSHR